jgi:hypothetical protein
MPTPSSGAISMQDVNTETNLNTNMYNFYSSSQVGGAGGLMYHNLAMGISSSQTAKQAIYDPFNTGASGSNLLLSGWYNYDQTPNGIMDVILINNNTENDITVDMFLRDPATPTDYPAGNFNLANTNGSDVNTANYDTNVVMNATNFTAGVYQIVFNITATYILPFPPPPGGGVTGNTTAASDTDGVGPGTARVTTNPPNFNSINPLIGVALVRGNITGNNGIYINKRTTFTLTFN